MNIELKRVKIAVGIPLANVAEVREAICEAGAGIIGNYCFCTMTTKGVDSFIPLDGASPYIGEKDRLEFVEEEKIEVVCDIDKVKEVIKRLKEVHPYEEPGIDIIPLIDEDYFD